MSDTTVRLLPVQNVEAERQRQTVELLEDFLAQAKRGEIDEVLIVADLTAREGMTWAWTRSEDIVGLVGRLERLKHVALLRMDATAEPVP